MVAKSLEGVAAQFEADTGIAVELVIKDFGSIRDEAITAIQPVRDQTFLLVLTTGQASL